MDSTSDILDRQRTSLITESIDHTTSHLFVKWTQTRHKDERVVRWHMQEEKAFV